MIAETARSDRCHVIYPDKGVEIVIPPQEDRICVVEEMITTEALSQHEDFNPIREAINFKVKIFPRSDELTKINFSPPIMIKVKFTFDDLKVVGDNRDQLKLAYLDEAGQWKLLETTRKDYIDVKDWMDLPPEGDTWAGHFIAKISKWGDPSVSIGH